jgi:lysophospholipase L1-like esterase
MSGPTRGLLKGIAASALLLLLSLALCVLAAEGVLRLLKPSGYFIWPPALSRVFLPAPGVMPGVSGESRFQANSLGLRANELSDLDRFRILTLGGSTTECLYLDQTETWPQLLQDALNGKGKGPRAWVGNAGMSARNSRHHVAAMRHLPLQDMKIDAVVLLAGINDLSIRLSQGDHFDPTALRDPVVQSRVTQETFLGLSRSNPRDTWYRQTRLWQLLSGLKARWTAGASAGKPGQQDDAGTVYSVWRQHRQQASVVLQHLPDLRSALDEYAGNLREIARLARARGVRLVLMTQPTMWRPGLPPELDRLLWFGGVGEFQVRPHQPYYSVEALSQAMRQYNDVVLKTCAEERVECIDLSALSQDTTVFYDDVHFNESGARQVAAIVAKHMSSRPPFATAP